MKALPTVISSPTLAELSLQVETVNQAILGFLAEVPDELLLARAYPEGWTTARNIKHALGLQKYTAFWLNLPPFFIKLLGKPRSPQKPIEKISATNRQVTDYGLYPEPAHPHPGLRPQLEQAILATQEKLKQAVERLSDAELDERKGMFGGMSQRTQVLFALKHAVHHVGVARARLEAR